MIAAEPRLLLTSASLLSKWGFNDGDAPDDWLDWCDDQGIDWRELPSWRHGILPALVRRFLLPALDQGVTVTEISTSHNPIRAQAVGTQDVEDCWHGDGPAVLLTPEYVEVPMTEVLRIAQGAMDLP